MWLFGDKNENRESGNKRTGEKDITIKIVM